VAGTPAAVYVAARFQRRNINQTLNQLEQLKQYTTVVADTGN
jgi:hypothetical protein